jgi:DNA polymerase/3'-5' exonuclease PolX
MVPDNKLLIDQFEKLNKQIQFNIDNSSDKKQQLVDMFRLQTSKKIIKIIEQFPEKIISVDQLIGIKGVGKGTIKRIEEILKTGKLSEINDDIVNDKYHKYLDELAEVFGIGHKTALNLFKKYNVTSIDELKKLYNKGLITLSDNVAKGLKYYGKYMEDIPRSETMLYDKLFYKSLYKIDPKLFGIICGSYRRLKTTSSDIDFMIIHPSYKNKNDTIKINYLYLFIKELEKKGYIIDSFTNPKTSTKYMGLIQLDKKHPIRRLDCRFIPYNSYYSALLSFTGPANFNKTMRQLAIDNGYLLSEYGLYNEKGIPFKVKSENDIFKLLGMEYISPENRK